MYFPVWLIIAVAVVVYFIYKSKHKNGSGYQNVEALEESVGRLKSMLFSEEHFKSPHFTDLQNTFDVMEANYFRLKQRLFHTPEKVLQVAKDWQNYVDALVKLKMVRVLLDVDSSDKAFDNATERSKEPSIVKDELEKKFRSMLGDDWQQIPPDFFQRIEDARTAKDLQ